jgi:hypothetical protein
MRKSLNKEIGGEMNDQRIPLNVALPLASGVYKRLYKTCEQIEIAGSIRRMTADVKDAEIVAIPTNATYRVLEEMLLSGEAEKARYSDGRNRWGDKYRGITVWTDESRYTRDTLRVELFFTNRDSWGYQLALRTGPGDANKRLMMQMAATPIRCIGGSVWYAEDWTRDDDDSWVSYTKRRVLVPTEYAWFSLWGMGFVNPEKRTPALYEMMRFDRAAAVLEPAAPVQKSLF